MADDLSNRGNQDRLRINTGEPYEVRDWADKFGVSEEELRSAIAKVGPMATDVQQHLASAD